MEHVITKILLILESRTMRFADLLHRSVQSIDSLLIIESSIFFIICRKSIEIYYKSFCARSLVLWHSFQTNETVFIQKKTDLSKALKCCQKEWHGIDEINSKQCVRCHKYFTRFDVYQTSNHIDYYCNICWLYEKEIVTKTEKPSLSIRCNFCGQFLPDQLPDDVIAMNFVHPTCLEKRLNE